MSVELEPQELGFQRPFQQEVTQVLRLRNPNRDPVAFKVKTTAPKQYCVRPNSGRIDAGGEVEVQVLLQAMKEDPPLDAKCRDKFLVQSVAIKAESEVNNVAAIWHQIEQTDKSAIQERKIRVIFLPANGEAASSPAGGLSLAGQRSPSPEAVTPQRQSGAPTSGPVSRPESRPSNAKSLNEINPPSNRDPVTSAVSSVVSAVPTTTDELKAQLAEAKNQIQLLTEQAGNAAGLRQRKVDSGSKESAGGSVAMKMQQAPAGGVPVQIVAGLCLLSFLLAYFLF